MERNTEVPCEECWEACASESLVESLAESAAAGVPRAGRLLANVADPPAAPALRRALDHREPEVRVAALTSLGFSGAECDVEPVTGALEDGDESVRRAARGTLAELGGSRAADALAGTLEEVDGRELDEVIQALAWLDDPRCLPAAVANAEDALFGPPRMRGHGVWMPAAWGAMHLAGGEWRERTCDRVVELARRVDPGRPWLENPPLQAAHRAYRELVTALRLELPEAVGVLEARIWEQAPEGAGPVTGLSRAGFEMRNRTVGHGPSRTEPPLERTVPKLLLGEVIGERPSSGPVAKFAGQPEWREAPQWPVTPLGRPLVFYGQLPIPGAGQRTAYVFLNVMDPDASHGSPLGADNALVIQPGSPSQLRTIPAAEGPQLFRGAPLGGPRLRRVRRHERYECFAALRPGADPSEWPQPDREDRSRAELRADWNKVGGVPKYLQREQLPAGAGWEFAFQFSADLTGRELADGAECYGFVDPSGRGAFLWQCH
ncbi:MAG TPA: HEAT repeat domain-containing protein [Solirubrobacteraceae bacterium]|nr:HEAT repeat domain-containing protein [Solirubrobacteraceae bacterium]